MLQLVNIGFYMFKETSPQANLSLNVTDRLGGNKIYKDSYKYAG